MTTTWNETDRQTATIGDAVRDFREANAAIRKIRRNDGRTAATTNAIARHQKIADHAMRLLVDNNHRYISGVLTDEEHLLYRLRNDPAPRPELQGRLELARGDIRRFVKLLGDRAVTE